MSEQVKPKMSKKKIILCSVLAFVLIVAIVLASVLGTEANIAAERKSDGVLPTDSDLQAAVKYDRVVIIGVDGAGGYFAQCDTPNFDRIFANGSVTYTGLSQYPTISAQNWTSMLHGVRYQKHRVTNVIASTIPYINSRYPSVFAAYHKLDPNAKFLSICSWAPINIGGIENMDCITKINTGDLLDHDDPIDWENDVLVAEQLKEYLDKDDYKITFLHLGSVDEVAHLYNGYGSSEYEEALIKADGLVGQIYDAYEAKGLAETTLFILVSDHGHRPEGGHGKESETERNTTFAVAGALGNVIHGTPGKVVTQDVASVVMYALGVKQPSSWESRVPHNLFNTLP